MQLSSVIQYHRSHAFKKRWNFSFSSQPYATTTGSSLFKLCTAANFLFFYCHNPFFSVSLRKSHTVYIFFSWVFFQYAWPVFHYIVFIFRYLLFLVFFFQYAWLISLCFAWSLCTQKGQSWWGLRLLVSLKVKLPGSAF